MQLHPQINAWLNQPDDYAAGLALLEAAGVRGILMRTLALGDDAYNRQRLETELRRVLDSQANNVSPIEICSRPGAEQSLAPLTVSVDYGVEPATVIVSKIQASDRHEEVDMSENSSGIDTLKQQAYDLMNERAELKARLRAFANDSNQQANRRDWAFRILATNDEIDELYSRIDFFNEYGYLPTTEEPAAEVDDTAALMNARTYVSRYRAKLKKPNLMPEQVDNYTKLLRQYEDEKAQLELKLKRQ